MHTFAWAPANSRTMASPMPEVPPVTRTRLERRSISISSSLGPGQYVLLIDVFLHRTLQRPQQISSPAGKGAVGRTQGRQEMVGQVYGADQSGVEAGQLGRHDRQFIPRDHALVGQMPESRFPVDKKV